MKLMKRIAATAMTAVMAVSMMAVGGVTTAYASSAETVAGGRMKVGGIYLLENEADGGRSVNVWCSSSYPATNQSNVCLWGTNTGDTAQQWKLVKMGSYFYLQSVENSAKYLDLYTGSGTGAGLNAQLYSYSATSRLTFETGSYSDTVKIKLNNSSYSNKYLTANQNSNGSRTGKAVGSAGNVYFYNGGLTDDSQDWRVIEIYDPDDQGGSGGDTSNQRLIMPINNSTITASYGDNCPGYHEQGFEDPNHYAVDMYGTPADFYASGDGRIVGYGGTTNSALGKWLAVQYDNVVDVNGDYVGSVVLRYCHLASIYKTSGEVHVDDATAMARVGNTGTIKTHLHVEADTNIASPNATPSLQSDTSSGLVAATSDTTIDPLSLFYLKESYPELQTAVAQQSYCTCHNQEYVNVSQVNNIPTLPE